MADIIAQANQLSGVCKRRQLGANRTILHGGLRSQKKLFPNCIDFDCRKRLCIRANNYKQQPLGIN